MSDPRPERPGIRVGVGTYEVSDPPQVLDLSQASVWRETVLLDGVPIYRVDLASPGVATPRLLDAAVSRRVDHWVAKTRLYEDLCRRMGVDSEPAGIPPTTISVVVCTHGRPDYLPRLFSALSELDPAPLEVVIVDNAPGRNDCRAEAEALGFTYVREDRKGLDNARNSAIRVARGELIAFTDDDCVPSTGWLRALPELFQDPSVAAVTGPMFPYALETRSQQYMDSVAGMVRGFKRQEFDWTQLSIAHGSALGVGANMSFRRSMLEELGAEPFPPELDAGTPTESGGDTYVFGRLLANNHRIIYAPEVYGFHDHRRDEAGLVKAVRGYGVGISAAMTRLLLEDHEFEAWRGWTWLLKQQAIGGWRWLSGRTERRQLRLSGEYVIGGFLGPARWLRSRIHESRLSPRVQPQLSGTAAAAPEPEVKPRRARSPKITVVIPSGGFGESLRNCVRSLGSQTLAASAYEVIVVDDRPVATDDRPLPPIRTSVRVLRSGGRGASAARNLGATEARAPVVLFLDDDMIASPNLLEIHLSHHQEDRPRAVVGSYLPDPVDPGLAAKVVALWWSKHFEAMRRGGQKTFVWMLSGNLSVPRDSFLELGGFPEQIPYRREDYELGLRWLGAGYELTYDPAAAASHEFRLVTSGRLRGIELEGFGDTLINRLYPGTSGALPLLWHRPLSRRWGLRTAAHRLLKRGPVGSAGVAALSLLERLRLRRRWIRLLSILGSSEYKHGMERGGFERREIKETLLDIELASDAPVTLDGPVPPTMRVTLGGEELLRLRPETGFWDAGVARQIADAMPTPELVDVAVRRGWLRHKDLPAERRRRPSVAVHELFEIARRDDWVQLIENTDAAFLAVLIGDEQHGRQWLSEALLPFDGELVAAVFGGGVAAALPAQPLMLFRRTFRPVIRWANRPAFIVFRTAALRTVSPELISDGPEDPLAFGLALITGLLEAEWTVGWRDVHGLLASQQSSPSALGRAWVLADFAAVGGDRRVRGVRHGVKAVATAVNDLRNGDAEIGEAIGEAIGGLSGATAILTGKVNGPSWSD